LFVIPEGNLRLHSLTQSANRNIRTKSMCSLVLVTALLSFSPALRAQGCAQCRDNAAATPPATQAAYRHAIILLVAAAGTIFTGTVVLLRRSR